MTQAAELAQRIVVIHREPGYLRLELPAELCSAANAGAIELGMQDLPGLSAATVDRPWQRISIRFNPQRCTTSQAARHLFSLLDDLPLDTQAQAAPPSTAETTNGVQALLDKLKEIIIPAGEAPAGSLQARFQPVVESALTEKAITNFFNDIVAFYLIKSHWDLITKRWLQQPLAYSNAWLTIFYLVFLLVRYRKTHS